MTISEAIKAKILSPEKLNRLLDELRSQEKKIVFTNGCFDFLHYGHVYYLAKAAEQGNFLVVGLNSDDSVKRLKGPSRPLTHQDARAFQLAGLSCVDAVVFFSEDTPYELIQNVQPDILVKGSEYAVEEIVGHDIVLAKGGKVIGIEMAKGFSTTNIINSLKLE